MIKLAERIIDDKPQMIRLPPMNVPGTFYRKRRRIRIIMVYYRRPNKRKGHGKVR